ncbi:hypothetical protein [Amycolatopsis sp. GA6-003]|uniref:hypothetical protein n=1 Tax=Amycolatopsis sp. GA6-003 TaxID=2652444 RepID=UPI0039173074
MREQIASRIAPMLKPLRSSLDSPIQGIVGKRNLIAGSGVVLLTCMAAIAGRVVHLAAALVFLWLLLVFCANYRARAEEQSGFRYHLADAGVRYIVPVTLGTAFYLLLSAYVAIFGDGLTYGWLLTLQHTVENVSTFFSDDLKLSPFGVLVTMVVLYLLGCLLLGARLRKPPDDEDLTGFMRFRAGTVTVLDKTFSGYRKHAGPIGAGLATLAAFTFFGLQLGNISHDLQLRIKIVQSGYADVAAQARQEVSEHVAANLYQKVYDAFSSSYRDAVAHVQDVHAAWSSATQHAEIAKLDHQVSDPDVDALLLKERTRENAVAGLDDKPQVELPTPLSTPDGDLTVDQVRTAQDKIHARQQKAIDVVSEGPKKIVLHVESLVSAKVLEVLKPLTTDIPITGPIVEAFSKAIDKKLQEKLELLYDRASSVAVRDPAQLDALIGREATALVAETDVTAAVRDQTESATRQVQAQADLITQLGDGSTKLDRAVAAKETAAAAEAAKNPPPKLKMIDPIPLNLHPPTFYDYGYPNSSRFPYQYEYPHPDVHPYTAPEYEGGGGEVRPPGDRGTADRDPVLLARRCVGHGPNTRATTPASQKSRCPPGGLQRHGPEAFALHGTGRRCPRASTLADGWRSPGAPAGSRSGSGR